jgi:hypothetical protein
VEAAIRGGLLRIPAFCVPAIVLFVLVAASLTGCADLKAFFFPPPPVPAHKEETPPSARPSPPAAPAPPAAPKEKPPPAVLSPQVGEQDAERLMRESSTSIEETEQLLQQIDPRRLTKNQQDTYTTIQSFLVSARQALVAKDYLRASNLADKAHALAVEMSQSAK